MKIIKKLVCAILTIPLLLIPFSVTAAVDSNKNNNELRFNKDGKFEILVLSDIQETNKPRKESTDLIINAIDKTNPDLIVLNGDNTAGWWRGVNAEKTKQAVDNICKIIDERKIPFALVFGNHDHEGLTDDVNLMEEEEAKELILSWYQNYETCLAIEGEELTGVGTYNLPIMNSKEDKISFNLWFIDSIPYTPEEEGGGYGYVHEDQTQWYINKSNELRENNGGEVVNSLLFQHIIVPEIYDMMGTVDKGADGAIRGQSSLSDKYYNTKTDAIYQGRVYEAPCSPDKNGGQFDSWLNQGDIVAAFFGHDHNNNFAGIYKGIHLVAVPAVTFYSYGRTHGVRTITIDENNPTEFKSDYLLFEDLVDYKPSNLIVANHGYDEYKNKFIPAIFGSLGGVAILTTAGFVLKKIIKNKKQKVN